MKLVFVLLTAVYLTVVQGVPSSDTVRNAISQAKSNNAARRAQNNGHGSSQPGHFCPLAAFHGRRSDADKAKDEHALDVLAALRLLKEEGYSNEELKDPAVLGVFDEELVDCPKVRGCKRKAVYRTIDGSCNNLQNPIWGMKDVPQLRPLGFADYDDGIGSPRTKAVSGKPLPNPRTISNVIHKPDKKDVRSKTHTLQLFQMGQFLDHDIIATPAFEFDCCGDHYDEELCFVIRVPEDDMFYKKDYCMNFVRSAASACRSSTYKGVREQINAITSYVDASNVYGSTEDRLKELRDGNTAFMKMEGGKRLPNNDALPPSCRNNIPGGIHCSAAGDHRVNVVPSLTAYHLMFAREHNRIARELITHIPNENDLFFFVRKIIIAIAQKITYDEFLASYLSSDTMNKYKLRNTHSYGYDKTIDASATNPFGITFRNGHTWIPDNMILFTKAFNSYKTLPTEDTYHRPELTYANTPPDPQGHAGLAYWLSGEATPETDSLIQEGARSFLFKQIVNGSTIQFDLAALNIQRGRDHGLPAYTEYRKWCGLSDVTSFSELVDHTSQMKNKLKSLYESPLDIDLFVGIMSEKPAAGGGFGPTAECIIARQFHALKFGDRFWYQNKENCLTEKQIEAINAYSMAKLQCNIYEFDEINAPSAFKLTDPMTKCGDIPNLDLKPFKPSTKKGAPPLACTGDSSKRTMDEGVQRLRTRLYELIEELLEEDEEY